ncbi:HTH domain-containing protein [Haloferax sp. S1W]|uniref:HTH domain-containing protein n=1 Tax=Haloferax sp. S1W TaxID=3377110 RepID=UPI0037CA865B
MTEAASAGEDEDDESALFDLLADEYARTILVATSRRAMSAKTLSEQYGMSLATVYRRVERLQAFGFLIEQTEIDALGGHHHSVYEANLDHIDIDLLDGELAIRVRLREDAADRLARLWREIRGG